MAFRQLGQGQQVRSGNTVLCNCCQRSDFLTIPGRTNHPKGTCFREPYDPWTQFPKELSETTSSSMPCGGRAPPLFVGARGRKPGRFSNAWDPLRFLDSGGMLIRAFWASGFSWLSTFSCSVLGVALLLQGPTPADHHKMIKAAIQQQSLVMTVIMVRSVSVAVMATMAAMARTIELKREIMVSVLMMMVMKMAIVAISSW